MYKRDLITSEIEKLAQVLARIMGLKVELRLEEAEYLFNETIAANFELPTAILYDEDLSLFENWLATNSFLPEKLDSLGEFLYYELGVSSEKNKLIAPKLNSIYDYLSSKHKIVHLVNMHRQNTIKQYL